MSLYICQFHPEFCIYAIFNLSFYNLYLQSLTPENIAYECYFEILSLVTDNDADLATYSVPILGHLWVKLWARASPSTQLISEQSDLSELQQPVKIIQLLSFTVLHLNFSSLYR